MQTVLYVVDGLGLSGKTKALADLACGLDRGRYRAEVVSLDPAPSPLRQRFADAAVPVHDIVCKDGVNARVLLELGRLVARVGPSVVHAYNQRPMLYGGLVARTLRVRGTVGTLSAFACMVPDRTYDFLPQALATRSWKNRVRNRVVAGLMDAIVTVSDDLGENFCKWNGIDRQKLRVITYGVDVDAFGARVADAGRTVRASFGFPDDAVVVGSVGRLVEQKDYPTQLEGFARAAADLPALHMVLAGEGPLRAELEATVARLGIKDRVRFLGHRTDVPAILAALDVFVIASRFEPFGVAVLEAKAAGVAIVGTQVNELPSLLGHGSCGELVPPRDPAALAAAFVRLGSDLAHRRALGARAAAEARARHSFRAVLGAYQDLYDEVASPVSHRNHERPRIIELR